MKISLNLEGVTVSLGTPGVWDYELYSYNDAIKEQKRIEIEKITRCLPSAPDGYSWTWQFFLNIEYGEPHTLVWEIVKD